MVNTILFYYDREKHMGKDSERKQHFLQQSSSEEVYMDGLKSTGRKVRYVAVFKDTTRGGELPEEVTTYTAEMAAMKEIKEKT